MAGVGDPPSSTRLGLVFVAGAGMVAVATVGLLLASKASRKDEDVPERIVRRKSDAAVRNPPKTPFTPEDPARPRSTEGLPGSGEYVYVEELPEAITKVPPRYPESARREGIEGTVVVQALVGKDGRVKETRIVRSVPELDAAAETAVRQWTFKPAKAYDKPIAVWVAVPVRFTLR